eukprot:Sspe_Gene.69582::Locus_41015_Transcript_1_2_Confidence_0.667_Length_2939::g.69582::m.69582
MGELCRRGRSELSVLSGTVPCALEAGVLLESELPLGMSAERLGRAEGDTLLGERGVRSDRRPTSGESREYDGGVISQSLYEWPASELLGRPLWGSVAGCSPLRYETNIRRRSNGAPPPPSDHPSPVPLFPRQLKT